MKKKILGILICMLLIGTGFVTSTSGTINENAPPSRPKCFYDWINETLSMTSVDPESSPVRFGIEWWGSDTVDLWTDYYDSGVEVKIDVRGQVETADVFAEDIEGARSEKVNVNTFNTLSKSKSIDNPMFYSFFEKFFEHFPILNKILNQIIQSKL